MLCLGGILCRSPAGGAQPEFVMKGELSESKACWTFSWKTRCCNRSIDSWFTLPQDKEPVILRVVVTEMKNNSTTDQAQLMCSPFGVIYHINSLTFLPTAVGFTEWGFDLWPQDGWLVFLSYPPPKFNAGDPNLCCGVCFEGLFVCFCCCLFHFHLFVMWSWRKVAKIRRKVFLRVWKWRYLTSIFSCLFLLLQSSTESHSLCRKVCWIGSSLWSFLFPLRPQKGYYHLHLERRWELRPRQSWGKEGEHLLMLKLLQKQYTVCKCKYSSPDPPAALDMMGWEEKKGCKTIWWCRGILLAWGAASAKS